MKNEVHECIPGRSEERGGRERGREREVEAVWHSIHSSRRPQRRRRERDDESERDGKHRLESPLAFPFHLLP